MHKQTVLVTGGCGYIGSHVVRNLTEQGHRAIIIDNLATGSRAALIHGETFYEADLRDTAALDRIFREHTIDAIMHFAASVSVPESVADPVKYFDNNTVGTLRVVTAAAKYGVKRLVFSSTAATYGQFSRMPVTEDDPVNPESPYGASKAMSERMLQDIAAAAGIQYVILRYFNVAGADPGGRIGQRSPLAIHLINAACRVAVGKNSSLTIYGTDYPTRDGTCIRDYVHVEDLAMAHLKALEHLVAGGSKLLLNCGYGRGSTVREVVATVKAVSGVNFPVVEGPRRPGDVIEVVAGVDRIKKVFDWRPRYDDLRTIVEHAYRWERQLTGV